MDDNETYSDSDDVEILEVVGVERGEDVAPPPAGPPRKGGDDRPDEYLLDFDDPEQGVLAEPQGPEAAPVGSAEGAVGDEDSDQQLLLRVRADYDNLRKRIDREREEFELYASFALVGRLLPVLDNLERALAVEPNGDQEESLREGLVMIYRQLIDELRQEGLTPVEAVGQPFDPNLHDAVATEKSADAPANTVLEEFQKGYMFQDRLLRPARVKVSTASAARDEDG